MAKKKKQPWTPPGKLLRLTKVERSTLRTALRTYADGIYGTMDDSENKLFSRLSRKLR